MFLRRHRAIGAVGADAVRRAAGQRQVVGQRRVGDRVALGRQAVAAGERVDVRRARCCRSLRRTPRSPSRSRSRARSSAAAAARAAPPPAARPGAALPQPRPADESDASNRADTGGAACARAASSLMRARRGARRQRPPRRLASARYCPWRCSTSTPTSPASASTAARRSPSCTARTHLDPVREPRSPSRRAHLAGDRGHRAQARRANAAAATASSTTC